MEAPVKVGIHPVNLKWPGGDPSIVPNLSAMAIAADQGGVEYFAMMDHYFMLEGMGGQASDPMLEGYAVSAYIAALTRQLQIGLLVTGVTYRHPGLLAKIVTTLDVLTGGRANLGIGAAWYEREHLALGVPFPPLAERFGRLEEALQICLQMWSEDDGSFEGRYYHLAETICYPQPVQRPHPPILIGGSGERKTLRLVAKYGDACNLFARDGEEVRHKLDVLRAHCEAEHREYNSIRKTILFVGDPFDDLDSSLGKLEEYAGMGVDLAIFVPRGDRPVEFVERVVSELVPRLADI